MLVGLEPTKRLLLHAYINRYSMDQIDYRLRDVTPRKYLEIVIGGLKLDRPLPELVVTILNNISKALHVYNCVESLRFINSKKSIESIAILKTGVDFNLNITKMFECKTLQPINVYIYKRIGI